jgi:hypothetical protein
MKVESRCAVCGRLFERYPSEQKKTCGMAECVAELMRRKMRMPSVGVCSKCGRRTALMRKGRNDGWRLCKKCWKVVFRTGTCKACGRVGILFSQGHCNGCFIRLKLNKRKVVCHRCRRTRTHHARGLCASCYVTEQVRKKMGRESGLVL